MLIFFPNLLKIDGNTHIFPTYKFIFPVKDAGPFLNFFFLPKFFDIVAMANQLPGFSISGLANIEDFFNGNISFKCKYICKYKQLII